MVFGAGGPAGVRSAAEVETLLDLAVAANQMNASDVGELLHDVNELMAVLRGLLKSHRKIGPYS
jgi:hypothetical protein